MSFSQKSSKLSGHTLTLFLAGPLWDFYMEIYDEWGTAWVIEDGAPIHRSHVAQNFHQTTSLETITNQAKIVLYIFLIV
jgi:hypothetical protein